MAVTPIFSEHSIDQFVLMFKGRQINLEPGFQRRSVWTWSDRARLIQSIVAGYPVPSIFLYKRHVGGRLIYDVIDGKQRLEAILMFLQVGRFKRQTYEAKDWPGSRRPEIYYDPRGVSTDPDGRASWHAKCVLVDDEVAFVTSANFTEWAQDRNVEAGALIRSRHFTSQLRTQFDSLVQANGVKRLPGF